MSSTQTLRELAIKPANAAELNNFSLVYKPDPAQTERISQSFSKTYPALSRNMIVCDSALVKQLCFVKPNFKLAVLSSLSQKLTMLIKLLWRDPLEMVSTSAQLPSVFAMSLD